MNKWPCMNCTERRPGCHGECKRYAEAREGREDEIRKQAETRLVEGFHRETVIQTILCSQGKRR